MPMKKVPKKPTERQNTAAWSNIQTTQELSQVAFPSQMTVIDAKEYVEENQK